MLWKSTRLIPLILILVACHHDTCHHSYAYEYYRLLHSKAAFLEFKDTTGRFPDVEEAVLFFKIKDWQNLEYHLASDGTFFLLISPGCDHIFGTEDDQIVASNSVSRFESNLDEISPDQPSLDAILP